MTKHEAYEILYPYIDENDMHYADDVVLCFDEIFDAFKIAVESLKQDNQSGE